MLRGKKKRQRHTRREGSVSARSFSGRVRVSKDGVRVKHYTLLAHLRHLLGRSGGESVEIPFRYISAIRFQRAQALLPGYIEFTMNDKQAVAKNGYKTIKRTFRIRFRRAQQQAFLEVKGVADAHVAEFRALLAHENLPTQPS